MRYNRDDYSACDWLATEGDKRRAARRKAQRRHDTAWLFAIAILAILIGVTLDAIITGA